MVMIITQLHNCKASSFRCVEKAAWSAGRSRPTIVAHNNRRPLRMVTNIPLMDFSNHRTLLSPPSWLAESIGIISIEALWFWRNNMELVFSSSDELGSIGRNLWHYETNKRQLGSLRCVRTWTTIGLASKQASRL